RGVPTFLNDSDLGCVGSLMRIPRNVPKCASHRRSLFHIDSFCRVGLNSDSNIAPSVNAATRYLELVSGQKRGLIASLQRCGLRLASWPYGCGMWVRNRLYDRGWKSIEKATIPVVSVGNLTVGGTGKTPCAEYVARFLNDRGHRV